MDQSPLCHVYVRIAQSIGQMVRAPLTERIMNPRFRQQTRSKAQPDQEGLQMQRSIIVKVDWDPEAKVWVAISDDMGIATEADTQEAVERKVLGMIRELLEMDEESYSD